MNGGVLNRPGFTGDLERLIGAIGGTVRKMHPEVTRIFVRPEPKPQDSTAPQVSIGPSSRPKVATIRCDSGLLPAALL